MSQGISMGGADAAAVTGQLGAVAAAGNRGFPATSSVGHRQRLTILVVRRVPPDVREDLAEEWNAELHEILRGAETLPVTRLYRGIRYGLGLLRVAPSIGRDISISTATPRAAGEAGDIRRLGRLGGAAAWYLATVAEAPTVVPVAGFAGVASGVLGVLGVLGGGVSNFFVGVSNFFVGVALGSVSLSVSLSVTSVAIYLAVRWLSAGTSAARFRAGKPVEPAQRSPTKVTAGRVVSLPGNLQVAVVLDSGSDVRPISSASSRAGSCPGDRRRRRIASSAW